MQTHPSCPSPPHVHLIWITSPHIPYPYRTQTCYTMDASSPLPMWQHNGWTRNPPSQSHHLTHLQITQVPNTLQTKLTRNIIVFHLNQDNTTHSHVFTNNLYSIYLIHNHLHQKISYHNHLIKSFIQGTSWQLSHHAPPSHSKSF